MPGIYVLEVKYLLIIMSILPLLGALCLLNRSFSNRSMFKFIALNTTCIFLVIPLFWYCFFNESISYSQFFYEYSLINSSHSNCNLAIDGISLSLIFLTTLLTPLCILINWNSVKVNLKKSLVASLVIEFFLTSVFLVIDLFVFYIFFGSLLIIPLYLITAFKCTMFYYVSLFNIK